METTEKKISDVVRTAYVNNVTVTAKEIQETLRNEGREVKRPTISRILRTCRMMERGYRKDGILGETSDKPEVLRSYGKEKTLTTFEIGLLTLSTIVGIATMFSVWYK